MAQGPNQVTAIEATFNCGYESQSPVAPGNDHFRNIFATVLRAHARVILERVIYRMPTLLSEPGFSTRAAYGPRGLRSDQQMARSPASRKPNSANKKRDKNEHVR